MSYVGLDIAKLTFVGCVRNDDQSVTRNFENTDDGFAKLYAWVATFTLKSPHYCMEATGKYGLALAEYLHAQGEKISIVNPFRIKHFGKSLMQRNKTDKADACLIAHYCQLLNPHPWAPKPARLQRIQALLRRSSQLESMQRQDKNRLELEEDKDIIACIQTVVNTLQEQIDTIERRINTLIDSDDVLSAKARLLKSIKGVGNKTVHVMLPCIGEAGQFMCAKQLVAYIGINPGHKQSGTSLNQSALSRMGDAYMRKMLYMPTLPAIRHNPLIKAFYERLLAHGKPKMVAVCAAMRKLVCIMFGVLKNNIPFDPNYQH